MKIFSGSSNLPLTCDMCSHLGMPIGNISLKQFPSGEQWCQFQENVRGENVFIVQSISSPVNDHLMQLLVMADAAKRASAGRLTAVIPYFGYSRQDRKDKSRVPISAKLIMNLLSAAGFDRILTMDLHSPQIGGFTDLPIDQLSFKPALIGAVQDLGIDCVVAPDIGAVKRADEYATSLKKDLVIITKKRNSETEVEAKHFIGDVKDKKVLIVDDLTESAGTLIESASLCKEKGALEVYCAVTHGCFTNVGITRVVESLKNEVIKSLFVSTTVACNSKWEESGGLYGHGVGAPRPNQADKVILVDVSDIFAKAILNISQNKSVSELFKV